MTDRQTLTAAEVRADDVIEIAGEARRVLTTTSGAHYVKLRTVPVDGGYVTATSYAAGSYVTVLQRSRRVGAITIPATLALSLDRDLKALRHLTETERELHRVIRRDIPTERL